MPNESLTAQQPAGPFAVAADDPHREDQKLPRALIDMPPRKYCNEIFDLSFFC